MCTWNAFGTSCVRATMANTIMYKPEVETVPQTGSTKNLTTKTDIDAISIYLYSWGQVFADLYANLTRRFFHAKFQYGGRIPEVVIIW